MRRALDAARRIQRSRAAPGTAAAIRSEVVAVARDPSGRDLAVVHLTGGDPYSFTAPILAWAAGKAAAGGVRPQARSARLKPSEPTPSKAPAPTRDFIASAPNKSKAIHDKTGNWAHRSNGTQLRRIGLSARSHPSGLT